MSGKLLLTIGPAPLTERPAAGVPLVVHVGQRDHVVQAHQLAHDRGPLGPRAAPGDVEVVAPGLGREPARSVRGDPALEPVAGPLPLLPGVEPAAGPVLTVGVVVDRARVLRGRSRASRRRHDHPSRLAVTPTLTDPPPAACRQWLGFAALLIYRWGYTMRAIPRNDLLTSVAELGVVAVAS